jgi:N-acetylglucosamine-6-sulfatase
MAAVLLARRRRSRVAVAILPATAALLVGCTAAKVAAPEVAACRTEGVPASAAHPNIVFVLADDLSTNLVRFMPHVLALKKQGTTFTNYTVTDSLCCPSRASIFTGRFPHDTGVFTNGGPDGGFDAFHKRAEEQTTFAATLERRGYRTALMGKYLNGYIPGKHLGGARAYVPPGWSEWDVAGGGYREFNYHLNQNHTIVKYGTHASDYLTDVLARRATRFLSTCPIAHQPFFLELATFAPHRPYVPAPRDSHAFADLRAPRTSSFDRVPLHAPPWNAAEPPLTRKQVEHIDWVFRRRVQADLAIDRALGDIEETLQRVGDSADTDIFFSSDNGYHLGEHRLLPGKMTAFDTDIRVPLVAAGPGIIVDRRRAAVVENVDLAPTFEALAGAPPSPEEDGRSLVPLLHGRLPRHWRTAALIEHHGPVTATTAGPDLEIEDSANPPSYEALRTATYTYVEYADRSRELYDLARDPEQTDNLVPRLDPRTALLLHESLHDLATCHGYTGCWRAGHALLSGPLELPRR